jgi:magnesium-transporting ATPase (P-type)
MIKNNKRKKEDIEIGFEDRDLVRILNGEIKAYQTCNINLGIFSEKSERDSYFIINQWELVREFFFIIALCHECVIESKAEEDNNQSQLPSQIDISERKRRLSQRSQQPSTHKAKPEPNTIEAQNKRKSIRGKSNKSMMSLSGLSELGEKTPGSDRIFADVKMPPGEPPCHNFQGPSPDEVALVAAANKLGMRYLGNTARNRIVQFQDEKINFEVFQIMKFTSDRKRAGIIVRHNNIIKHYIKGADNIILERLNTTQPQPYLKECKSN